MSSKDHYTVTIEVRKVWWTQPARSTETSERNVDEVSRVVVRADTEQGALDKAVRHLEVMSADGGGA